MYKKIGWLSENHEVLKLLKRGSDEFVQEKAERIKRS